MNTLARIIALLLLPFVRLRLAWERHRTARVIARLAPEHPELVETDEQRQTRLFAEAQAKVTSEQLAALAACAADHQAAMAQESSAMAELKRIVAKRGVSELRFADKAARVAFPNMSDGRMRARVTWSDGKRTTYILVGPYWYVDGTGERIDISGTLCKLLEDLHRFREAKAFHPMIETLDGDGAS